METKSSTLDDIARYSPWFTLEFYGGVATASTAILFYLIFGVDIEFPGGSLLETPPLLAFALGVGLSVLVRVPLRAYSAYVMAIVGPPYLRWRHPSASGSPSISLVRLSVDRFFLGAVITMAAGVAGFAGVAGQVPLSMLTLFGVVMSLFSRRYVLRRALRIHREKKKKSERLSEAGQKFHGRKVTYFRATRQVSAFNGIFPMSLMQVFFVISIVLWGAASSSPIQITSAASIMMMLFFGVATSELRLCRKVLTKAREDDDADRFE